MPRPLRLYLSDFFRSFKWLDYQFPYVLDEWTWNFRQRLILRKAAQKYKIKRTSKVVWLFNFQILRHSVFWATAPVQVCQRTSAVQNECSKEAQKTDLWCEILCKWFKTAQIPHECMSTVLSAVANISWKIYDCESCALDFVKVQSAQCKVSDLYSFTGLT